MTPGGEADDSILVWHVQNWGGDLGIYSNPEAAKEHANHVIGSHFKYAMDRNRVPESCRVVDWRMRCCGHLLGPGFFDHADDSAAHSDGCTKKDEAMPLVLYPFWAADGKSVQTGHTSTAWEIGRGVVHARFGPNAWRFF